MQTLLTLLLGISSLVSVFYTWRSYRGYLLQLKINEELAQALKEIEAVKGEVLVEQIKLRKLAQQVASHVEPAPEPAANIRGKPWLN
jgi:hypothetical protein